MTASCRLAGETADLAIAVERIVEAVRRYADAGFTHLAFVQVGPDQEEFCELYGERLAPALREL